MCSRMRSAHRTNGFSRRLTSERFFGSNVRLLRWMTPSTVQLLINHQSQMISTAHTEVMLQEHKYDCDYV